MKLEYIATNNDINKTIKEILISHFKISYRLLVTLKKNNCIFLNNSPSFIYSTLKENDNLIVSFEYEEDNSNIIPKEMELDIVYEDDWYLIINKPAGIPVHPSILHYEDSLSNGIRFYFDKIGLKKKIRPVNRIDKDTSGLVIFAKNEYIQECLIRQMQNNNFIKEYIAIVEGFFNEKNGIINEPISRKEDSIIERCIHPLGSPSITHYSVIEEMKINSKNISKVKCKLETGRTHQIRVHMSYVGHPLLGDDLYGGDTSLINRQALHSYQISFFHPITKQRVSYSAILPKDLLIFQK